MTKRPAFFIIAVAALLVLTLAPVYGQPADASPDQGGSLSLYDSGCQIVAIASSLFRLDHDPRWTYASFTVRLAYTLPKTLPSSPDSRAPPA